MVTSRFRPNRPRSRVTPLVVILALIAAVGGQLFSVSTAAGDPGPIMQRKTTTVTADALPNAQINGVVWAQVVIGYTVFAGGDFSRARPAGSRAGTNEVARTNLLSYDIRTGVLLSFAPVIDQQVKALAVSADQTTLYAGGDFTSVNGVKRDRFAAFTIATGALTSAAPDLNGSVNAIAVINKTVYLGGAFGQVNGWGRSRLAAIDTPSGALLSTWIPNANSTVRALVPTPDHTRIIVGGSFGTLNAVAAPGMGSLDAVTAAVEPWEINTVIQNSGDGTAILSLSADQDTIYGSGYAYGGGNYEGVFAADPMTGSIKWLQDCHGDTYSVAPIGDQIYSVGHAHYCSNIGGFPDTQPRTAWHWALAATRQPTGFVKKNGQLGAHYGNFEGKPAPSLFNWFPDLTQGTFTGQSQSAWTVTGTADYLLLGGEFTAADGTPQQGLVRLAVPRLSPRLQGPRETGDDTAPVASVSADGKVVISWQTNWDRDDQLLTYQLLRNGVVIHTAPATSQFWSRPTMTFTDNTGMPNTSYTYQVRVLDPDQNTVLSPNSTPFLYPSSTAYADRIRAGGPIHQWRLGSLPGQTTDPDTVGSLGMTVSSGVTFGAPGAVRADADTSATFTGTATSLAKTTTNQTVPASFSFEAWFATSATGGSLIGFESNGSYAQTVPGERVLYLNTIGRLVFAERPQSQTAKPVTVASPGNYKDGKWHQLVVVHTAKDLRLYVDGVQVGLTAGAAAVPTPTGGWFLGGPASPDWPSPPTAGFKGRLDDVSLFARALTAREVHDHYTVAQPRYNVITVVGLGRRPR
jgi:hypothetical protein